MKRLRSSLLAVLALAALLAPTAARAQSITLPDDAKFVVRVDVQALQNSEVAGPIVAMLKEQVIGKMADKHDGMTMEKLVEILGFDPFEEVQSVVLAASGYESPETSIVACVRLKKTAGNIEGLMLAIPGYSSGEHGELTIHSVDHGNGRGGHAAMYVDDDGNHSLLVAADRGALEGMLDAMGEDSSPGDSKHAISTESDGGELAMLDLYQLPEELMAEEGPPANVAKIVRSLSARVSESGDDLNVVASVVAGTDKQAEQLEQMINGLRAMVELAVTAHGEDKDEDLIAVHKYLAAAKISREGTAVNVNLSVPSADVRTVIADNLLKD
jgi:hypothetical protein